MRRRHLFWTLAALNAVLVCAWWVVGVGASDAWIAAADAERACGARVEQELDGTDGASRVSTEGAGVEGRTATVEVRWRDRDDVPRVGVATCTLRFDGGSSTVEGVRLP